MDEQIKYEVIKSLADHPDGNKGRKPATTIPDETRRSIVDLYRTKFMMQTSAISPSYWKSMNRSRYHPLLLPIFWKANTFFPQR